MTTPLSAVLVTYNSAHCVGDCLTSLRELVRPAEVVVVDNASADDSVAAVRRAAPGATVLEPGANLGFGRACNLAVEHARSANVMFVNPDVVFARADLGLLEADLAADPLGLVVPLLSGPAGDLPRHVVYPYPSWRTYVRRQAWAHVRPRELRRRSALARSRANAWPAATVLIVRREEYRSLGGFDARYFLYAEDVDLARRYRERDLPVRLTDALVARHAGASSSASDDDANPVPHAWSILGTLEYVSIWDGAPAARRAAAFALRSLRVQRLGLRMLPGGRMGRKRRQVEAIESFLVEHARREEGRDDYCPGARVALRSSLG